jgi:hypothetical protein
VTAPPSEHQSDDTEVCSLRLSSAEKKEKEENGDREKI